MSNINNKSIAFPIDPATNDILEISEKLNTQELDKSSIFIEHPYRSDYTLQEYELNVREVADQNAYTFVRNHQDFCSQITSANIFRTTRNDIFIYSTGFRKNLPLDHFGFKKELFGCLERVKMAHIILDYYDIQSTTDVVAGILRLAQSRPDNIKIYKIKNYQKAKHSVFHTLRKIIPNFLDRVCPQITETTSLHFTIGDKKKLRFEYDEGNKFAMVNYNDPYTANALLIAFNELVTQHTVTENI